MVNPTDAKRELAKRELARRDLAQFAWYTHPDYHVAKLHWAIARALEHVEEYVATGGASGIGRLMIFCPPRHGKSELVSVRFPAWFLGRHPDKHVLLVSCNASLATGFSRQVRNLLMDTPFKAVFGDLAVQNGIRVAEDSRAADVWGIAGHSGGMTSAGVGGAIVGRGADVAIIDDPFRDRADAESKPVRDRVDDWYRSVFYSRLEKGGAIVLMHQRWHEDDLAGRLLKRMSDGEGDDWTVINLPAIAEEWAAAVTEEETLQSLSDGWVKLPDLLQRDPGSPLWPQKYSAETLAQTRAVIGEYEWEAMYQQRPRRIEGALIKANAIPITETIPEKLDSVRYWDLAVSEKTGADYIVGALVGREPSTGRLYILDVRRLRGPWAEARPEITRVMLADPAHIVQGVEISGQQGGYFQELQRDPQLQGRTIVGVNPSAVGNKTVRAQIWASRIEDNLVWMFKGPWNKAFVAECIAFPRGAHDDQVDGVSGAVQMLSNYRSVAVGKAWRNHDHLPH